MIRPSYRVDAIALVLLMSGCLMSGCASTTSSGDAPVPGAGSGGTGSIAASTPAADGEVIAQATVLQIEGAEPELCLGGVAESYPPQCGGPVVIGWDWEAAGSFEEASGVTWAAYAVQGTWDGVELTITQPPITLSLYDAAPIVDPRRDPSNAGVGAPGQLRAIQDELIEDDRFLSGGVENGYLFVTVVFDDGSIQQEFDARFGSGLVAVDSALRPVG